MVLLQAQSRHSSKEIASNPEPVQKSIPLSTLDVKVDKVENSQQSNSPEDDTNQTAEISTEQLTDNNTDTAISDITDTGANQTNEVRNDSSDAKTIPVTDYNIEIRNSSTEDDSALANSECVLQTPSSAVVCNEVDSSNGNHPADTNSNISSASENASLKVDGVRPESESVEAPNVVNGQKTESGSQPEQSPNANKQQDVRAKILPKKIEEQLDEVNYFIL